MAKVIEEHVKDPGSAITHFIGMLMAIFAAIPLLIKAAHEPGRIYLVSIAVYAVSLILLYAASTTYHTFNISKKVNLPSAIPTIPETIIPESRTTKTLKPIRAPTRTIKYGRTCSRL